MERRDFVKNIAAAGLASSLDLACLGAEESAGSARDSRGSRRLLIGFSWGTADIGGIGIVPGLLNLIKKADPNLPATVFACQSGGSSSFKFVKGYLPRFLPGCRVLPSPFSGLLGSAEKAGTPGSAWHAFYERWGETKLREFESGSLSARIADRIARDVLDRLSLDLFHELERKDPEAARAFTDAGFFLYTSGTMLNFGREGHRNFWSKGTGLRFSMPLFVARALKIPYGVFSHSFDAVEWPVDLVFRPAFKEARFVFCRDTDSLEYLKQRDLLNANTGFRPDSTFFFSGLDEAWADKFMQAHGLKTKEFITVIGRYPEHKDPELGSLTRDREQKHMEKWKRLIEGWIEKTGTSVLICPETKFCMPHMRERLYSILSPSAQEKCVCMDSFWTPEQACSIYKRARIVTGHMHTMIFALSVGTPVMHIQFAEAGRKAWMIKDVGLGDWLFDIDETSGEELIEAAIRIHGAYDVAEQRVQKALRLVERLGLEVIAEVKTNWRTGRSKDPASAQANQPLG